MLTTLYVFHWVAALLIGMQAIDRIFRCTITRSGLCANKRLSLAVKGFAWSCMAFASFGVLAGPMFEQSGMNGLLINSRPSLAEAGLFIGFATLIVRNWAIEVMRHHQTEKLHHAKRRIARCSQPGNVMTGEPQA